MIVGRTVMTLVVSLVLARLLGPSASGTVAMAAPALHRL
jgi:O-antigen/teichoic acid export membrane protein